MEKQSVSGDVMVANKYFDKYQYLAFEYARKIDNVERLGIEQDDVVQELRLKIYLSVFAYLKKWRRYKETGRVKPVPIEYYVRTALNMRICDFITEVKKEDGKVRLSKYNREMDLGKNDSYTNIDWKGGEIVVRDVDILQGLKGAERSCFCLFLKGFSKTDIGKMYKKIDVKTIINRQVEKLQVYKIDLLQEDQRMEVQVSYED